MNKGVGRRTEIILMERKWWKSENTLGVDELSLIRVKLFIWRMVRLLRNKEILMKLKTKGIQNFIVDIMVISGKVSKRLKSSP